MKRFLKMVSKGTMMDDQFESFLDTISANRKSAGQSVAEFRFMKTRVKLLSSVNDVKENSNGIVYWMSRDQRVQDNWAFLYAQRLALKCSEPLHVCFCLVPKFLDATIRHYDFMLKGLQEVEQECIKLNISFHLLIGEARTLIPSFVLSNGIGGVVTDFAPLRLPLKWVDDVRKALPEDVTFCQVDTHNVIPCWTTSEKLQYAARTIRPKIHAVLQEYLSEFPPVIYHPFSPEKKLKPVDWQTAISSLDVDTTVGPVQWAVPGSNAAFRVLYEFINNRLKFFATDRNDPTKDSLSNLSPWIHFGQISAQRCVLEVMKFKHKHKVAVDVYVEEAVVRRELADNFCYYNPDYDSVKGGGAWAQKTLEDHCKDKREYLYSLDQFEEGKTHDDLWNAAQRQMVVEGKMHGFLRMYWAKKILEWTTSPEEALRIAIYLNDRYELDGRDPNGYVGCMWSIVGVHDQGFQERPVFGKIRYMNYKGCKRKFEVDDFVERYASTCQEKKKRYATREKATKKK